MNSPKKNTLRKHQILRSQKEIDEIFNKGERAAFYPLRFIALLQENTDKCTANKHQFIFFVAKKIIPLAVNRNKIKRWLREVFRTEQYLLALDANRFFQIAVIFSPKKKHEVTIDDIRQSVRAYIQFLNKKNN